jgi:hypothetical protein
VKKVLLIASVLLVALSLMACVSTKNKVADGLADSKSVNRPEIIDYKGSEFNATPPQWIQTYIESDISGVEKLDRYKDKYCVVVEMDGKDKEGVMLALSNLKAPVEIAGRVSTRVQQRFAGAQVGDVDKIETYMENVVKVAREATFSGFGKEGETWTYLQYFKTGKKKEPDFTVYRGYQLWSIDKAILQKQIDAMLNGEAKKETSAEKKTAIDRVKEAFYEGF